MDRYTALAIVKGIVDTSHEDEYLDAWQYVYDNDLIKVLSDKLKKQAQYLIAGGFIEEK